MKNCILIFDDDEEILLVCKIILEKQHYRVETRKSCDQIIDVIGQVKPAIILMDLWIPQIGGENALKLVKSQEDTLHIPVILFSANAQLEEISKRSNANGYLKKPFDIAALLRIIESNIFNKVDSK